MWLIHANKSLCFWFNNSLFTVIRFYWTTQGLWWNGWLLKIHESDFLLQNSSNIISNQQGSKTIQLKVAFLQFKKKQKKNNLELHKAASLWTEQSTEINAFKVFTTVPTPPNCNEMSFNSKSPRVDFRNSFIIKITVNLKQNKSKHFFSAHHEKKPAGGKKTKKKQKKNFQYKELWQIKSTSDALLWHKGLSSWSQPGDCLSVIWRDILYWSKKVPGIIVGGEIHTTPTKKKNKF